MAKLTTEEIAELRGQKLSRREIEVLELLDCGWDDMESMADEMGISQYTLRDKVRQIRAKIGAAPAEVTMAELPEAARAAGYDLPECDSPLDVMMGAV